MGVNNFNDNKTPDGKMFLVGYRKFLVALLWTGLAVFGVIWVLAIIKPSAGQVTVVLWLVSSAGLYCSFFVGGNALAKLWAAKYAPPQTTSTLTHETSQEEVTHKIEIIKYDPQEDAAWGPQEKALPRAKARKLQEKKT